MSASRVPGRLAVQLWTICTKTRGCHAALLQRYCCNNSISQPKRLISTTQCFCKDTKDENSNDSTSSFEKSVDKKELSVESIKDRDLQDVDPKVTSVKNSEKQSDVLNARNKSKASTDSIDASSSSDGSSSDSESDSSSDSDVEAISVIDPALQKAADNVSEMYPGDKAKTKTELLSKVLEKMKTRAVKPKPKKLTPQDLVKQKPSSKQPWPEVSASPSAVKSDQKQVAVRRKIVPQDMIRKRDPVSGRSTKSDQMQRPSTPKAEEDKPELTADEREKREERRRSIVEKMKKIQITKTLMEPDNADARRQEKKQQMFREINNRKKMVSEDGTLDDQQPVDEKEGLKSRRRLLVQKLMRKEEKRVLSAFEGKPLNIFTRKSEAEVEQTGKKYLYDILQEEREALMYSYPPRNAWEEQIQWTQEGKLWTFPIDNEAGWDKEKKVGFQEHVFLERQLKDFPQRGPIRHFMELVTVALSKNPYMTVPEKHGHIDWFRQYFKNKESVLLGPLGDMGKFKDTQNPDNSSA